MVFSAIHGCDKNCKRLVAYVRIDNKLKKIGYFGTGCEQFELLNLQKEAEDRLTKAKLLQMNSETQQVNRENRERRNIIKNQLVNPNRFIQRNDTSNPLS